MITRHPTLAQLNIHSKTKTTIVIKQKKNKIVTPPSTTNNPLALRSAKTFLQEASQFKLGKLTTEKPHPLTGNLSELANNDVGKAIECLQQVDRVALEILQRKEKCIKRMHESIHQIIQAGGKIYICGCGATGRLSISLEMLWRQQHPKGNLNSKVVGFSAGGDTALIKAIEGFEDHPEWGAKQLCELGFSKNDLCIAITEGGETPWVIGAVNEAALISKHKPFFLYCNPDAILKRAAKRSADVLANSKIIKCNLCIGPMAIAGSTRMQASTVLMAAAGFALFGYSDSWNKVKIDFKQWILEYKSLNAQFLKPFIIKESGWYRKKSLLIYTAQPEVALTILTDTTERAPTFSLLPFENINDTNAHPALCYLCLPDTTSSASAWKALLHRAARTIEWAETKGAASKKRLLGYDISIKAKEHRKRWEQPLIEFSWSLDDIGLSLQLGETKKILPIASIHPLARHLILKMLLNIHSTIMMGRMGRYEGNLMTWVRPSNKKLIDRAVRYTRSLLAQKEIHPSYSDVVKCLFSALPTLPIDQSIVLHLVALYQKNTHHLRRGIKR